MMHSITYFAHFTTLGNIGCLIYFVAQIWFIAKAFEVGTGWGIAVLIVPFGWLAFVVMHCSDGLKPFLVSMVAFGMMLDGLKSVQKLEASSVIRGGNVISTTAHSERVYSRDSSAASSAGTSSNEYDGDGKGTGTGNDMSRNSAAGMNLASGDQTQAVMRQLKAIIAVNNDKGVSVRRQLVTDTMGGGASQQSASGGNTQPGHAPLHPSDAGSTSLSSSSGSEKGTVDNSAASTGTASQREKHKRKRRLHI